MIFLFMEKQRIVELFLKNKMQIDRESLGYIIERRLAGDFLEEMAECLKKEGKYLIGTADIKKYEGARPSNEEIMLLKRHVPLPESISMDDIIQDRIRTYETVRKLLSYRWELTNMTSINKISGSVERFSLIGEVVEADSANKTMVLQDNTGVVTVSVKNLEDPQISQASVGDIVGVVCENNGRTSAAKVVYPDIPLFKDRKTPKERAAAAFVCGLSASNQKKQFDDMIEGAAKNYKRIYVFDFEEGLCDGPVYEHGKAVIISDDETEREGSVGKAALLSISGVNLLACHKSIFPGTETPKNLMTSVLKKRIINYQKIAGMPISPLVIDPTPDIFVTNMGGNQQSNYKNTVLLSIGGLGEENMFWLIDLQTYECLKIPLA